MKRISTPKEKRKQAEESILRNMRDIKGKLEKHRQASEEPVDKERVMNVLTQFLKLKKTTEMH